jgi:hypothetical protein
MPLVNVVATVCNIGLKHRPRPWRHGLSCHLDSKPASTSSGPTAIPTRAITTIIGVTMMAEGTYRRGAGRSASLARAPRGSRVVVSRVLAQIGRFRGLPKAIRSDHGPEFTSRALDALGLCTACRFEAHLSWQADAEPLHRELQLQISGVFGAITTSIIWRTRER